MIKLIGLALAAILTISATPTDSRYGRPLVPQKPCLPVTMPDIIGQSHASVVAELQASRITDVWFSQTAPEGALVAQSSIPVAGVSFYPCTVTVIVRMRWL